MKTKTKTTLTFLFAFLAVASHAFGQSSPGLYQGQVPSAAQWNAFFAAKQDFVANFGTAAYYNIGTSGGTVPVLNGANTWSATQAFADITAVHVNGNAWTTGTGTLTIAASKTLTASNTLTLSGTDGSTLNVGSGGTLGPSAFQNLTINSGTSGQLAYYATTGQALSGLALGTNVLTGLGQNTNSATGFVTLNGLTTTNLTTLTTGSAPASGKLGQVVSAQIVVGSAFAVSNAADTNVTNVALTAGTWTCSGNVGLIGTSTTSISTTIGWVSTTSATEPALPNSGGMFIDQSTRTGNGNTWLQAVPGFTINTSGTPTVYLGVNAAFTGTAPTTYGALNCQRVG